MKNVLVAACCLLCSTPAFAAAYFCDHPGTPNPVKAYPVDAHTIELLITNTAKEGANRIIVFEVEDKQGHVDRSLSGEVIYGEALPWDSGKLAANTTYCYRVWTRDDNDKGCRSEVPSGWACAATKQPYSQRASIPGNGQTGGIGNGGGGGVSHGGGAVPTH